MNNMKESVCKINSGFKVLLEAINNTPAGTAFIEDEKGILCGIVTDGDFRRMLLAGKDLNAKIEQSDLKSFISAKKGEDFQKLLEKTNQKINIIPIVDEENRLIDYFEFKHRTKFTPVAEPSLDNRELEYLLDAFSSTWISSRGKYIDSFEENFSKYCTTKHGVAVSNGTVAIHLALVALGIKEGDEVIVPDLTFAATINAVLHANATPVIVDVEKDSWTIDPIEIRRAITSKTKAIIPVHVYGQPCKMDEIMLIAKEHNLKVIEDCAEAHGAEYKGQRVGSFGDISTFSFFANKIITTGEGGMCMTNSSELDDKMRVLRDHGMSKEKRYWHIELGFNYRMTNLQAAIGCAQLEKIESILERNDKIEQSYIEHLDSLNIIQWQKTFSDRKKVVWLMCCTSAYRDQIKQALVDNGIDVRPFFYCLSEMPLYSKYTFSSKNAREISKIGMNLPTVNNVDYQKVQEILKEMVGKL
tara:strand:+ start:1247 stop:2662 length:1416 start_codon:yes stop_codon:yes gene_type:complete